MTKHFNMNTNPKKELIYIFQSTKKGCIPFLKKTLVLSLSCCLFAGCGGSKKANDAPGTASFSEQKAAQGKAEAQVEQFNKMQEEKANASPTPTPQLFVDKSKFRYNEEVYDDNVYKIKTLGLKEYDEIKSDGYDEKEQKGYLDTPAKGKCYLVLFLEITNTSQADIFIHPDCLTAKVDGKKVEHTFLKNAPEGYKTIFKTVKAAGTRQGFVVWEVPKKWKKMNMTFTVFEYSGGNRFKLSFTKKDLKAPDAPEETEE